MISNIKPAKNESGQAMVEFAIILPILLVLVFGIIQFGITFNNYMTLTDAVRRRGRPPSAADIGRSAPLRRRVRSALQAR
jgi:Flp pilus assembly protein TadG